MKSVGSVASHVSAALTSHNAASVVIQDVKGFLNDDELLVMEMIGPSDGTTRVACSMLGFLKTNFFVFVKKNKK